MDAPNAHRGHSTSDNFSALEDIKEVMGGTWVEPDCNVISAEPLARQFLLGRLYFWDHFGDIDTPVLWLPDTFGYTTHQTGGPLLFRNSKTELESVQPYTL